MNCKTETAWENQILIIKRKLEGRDKLRVWDENIHMNICQADNEKGPTEYNMELSWTYCNNVYEKKTEKEYMYIRV